MVGKFGKWSKENSKFLQIEPGETIEVEWTGEALKAKNSYGTEGWEFEFRTEYGVKTYFLSNGGLVSLFDEYVAGEKLVISRSDRDGNDKTKVSIKRVGE